MASFRALAPGDLPAVADLYARVMRSEPRAPASLVRAFEQFLLESPTQDPEITSLVAESDDKIVGFLGVHARRMVFQGEPIRGAVSGQLVAEAGGPVGVLLMRKFLAGPQDFSVTDGATAFIRRVWESLGGDTLHLPCVRWTRLLRPGGIVCLHDYDDRWSHRGVRVALDRFEERYPEYERIASAGTLVALRKRSEPARPEITTLDLAHAALLWLPLRLQRTAGKLAKRLRRRRAARSAAR